MNGGAAEWQLSRAFLPTQAKYSTLGTTSSKFLPSGGARVGKLAAPLLSTAYLCADLGMMARLATMLRHRALLWLGDWGWPRVGPRLPLDGVARIAASMRAS